MVDCTGSEDVKPLVALANPKLRIAMERFAEAARTISPTLGELVRHAEQWGLHETTTGKKIQRDASD